MKEIILDPKKSNNETIRKYEQAVELGRFSQHVLPYQSKWAVRASLSEKVDKVFDLQRNAIEYSKQKAKPTGSSVFIHNRDGYIRQRISYSKRIKLGLSS